MIDILAFHHSTFQQSTTFQCWCLMCDGDKVLCFLEKFRTKELIIPFLLLFSQIKSTYALSLAPVTMSPSRSVVYIVKMGPVWAFSTTRISVLSFHTYTSPLMAPVNVRLFWKLQDYSGLILSLRPANERRRYFVTTSLIGWEQA